MRMNKPQEQITPCNNAPAKGGKSITNLNCGSRLVFTAETTLQPECCSVVSAVKTIWLPPPSRLPPAMPRTVSVPAVRLRLTRPRSMPLCIPFRSTLSLPASSCTSGPFPPAHLSAPSLCSFPQRAAQPAPPRSLPFRHSPGSAHRNYSSKKQKNAPFFCFFISSPRICPTNKIVPFNTYPFITDRTN